MSSLMWKGKYSGDSSFFHTGSSGSTHSNEMSQMGASKDGKKKRDILVSVRHRWMTTYAFMV